MLSAVLAVFVANIGVIRIDEWAKIYSPMHYDLTQFPIVRSVYIVYIGI